ncbi:hypothetical protein [Gordonia westfalica]|uniref:DUF1508 domain-containing protein n=1 Tax=Gordonia westfalica TaxID=158898 RepID=A0A1H2DLA6_9ACTN|nr:hypothetical protein [Gordonia westfalica]SDT83700.1 hypothetical protein SAMN04488548_10120 [Gordonia westfalica]SDT85901.1 hypothetical protein SAMN04488548_12118 [Gordonia westfalica]SDT85960.1 hypothetical protein SAMN04488548_12128 [Gordonia westfalica]
MIVYENIPEKVSEYRGTIEVYEDEILQVDLDAKSVVARHPEWRWRCKSRNGQILAQGKAIGVGRGLSTPSTPSTRRG